MSKYNIIISRCTFTSGVNGDSPKKIIGFNVQNSDASKEVYHETILQPEQFIGKTDEQCVEIAFGILSGSIASTIDLITTTPPVVGNYYIPG